jgi:predicted dehydrogenase/MoaA/NifB/PqqE/SkfB family radical SAM enzyme
LRGGTGDIVALQSLVGQARDAGFGQVTVRTPAVGVSDAAAASVYHRIGVDSVIVPIYSHVPQAHDRIAGRNGALIQALVGMRAFAEAGLAVEIETPILPKRLQNLSELIALAHRAVPKLRAARFYLSRDAVPGALTPPSWSEAAPALAEAIRKCKSLGIQVALRQPDAIPLCALKEYPDLWDVYKLNPRANSSVAPNCKLGAGCGGCAVRRQCAGITPAYAAANGDAGLSPFDHRPEKLYDQRTTPRRTWTEGQKKAASKANIIVLRPTVNCNQDCTFCSANETSNNIWADPVEMYKTIARVARRGVNRLSFSGGEPTLSKHLPSFIRIARRAGVPTVEIISNGVLLDNQARVDQIVQAGLTHAFISLHAHTEAISRVQTQKIGDFPKTVKAIKLLLDSKVEVVLNHVINARNYRYLKQYVEFVHQEFGGRVLISFAFVTPQYKALENIDLVPRLSDVMPYLKRAMYRALELKQSFIIGARQGLAPCFLDEFRAWSDMLLHVNEAKSEDEHQKTRGAACDECRYRNHCSGLWRPYVAKYGFGEVKPWKGDALTETEVRSVLDRRPHWTQPWCVPGSFEDLPEIIRDRASEAAGPPNVEEAAVPSVSLPVMEMNRSRPLRVAMIGTGRQATRLARGAGHLTDVAIEAVASPHAPEAELPEFGHVPRFRTAAEAIEEVRPEALIVAASTQAHAEIAWAAIKSETPTLIEKPLARTEEEAEALVRAAAAANVLLMPAHNDLFATGLGAVLDGTPAARVNYTRLSTLSSPDSPRAWGRSSLFETLYHALVLTGQALGGGVPTVTQASSQGSSRPERIRLSLAYPKGEANLLLDFAATTEELSLKVEPADSSRPTKQWKRAGREISILVGGQQVPVRSEGGEHELMIAHFRDVVLGRAKAKTTAADALDLMRAGRLCIEALEAAGAPFDRPNAPKHVASRLPEMKAS